MAIFGFKKRKDEKLEQGAASAKSADKSLKKAKIEAVPGKKKGTANKETATKAITVPVLKSMTDSNAAAIIIRPRVTEKSGLLSQSGVYSFQVAKQANKATVAKAFTALYKLKPVRVSIINTSEKNIFVRGKRGFVPGIKKAIITVKKGEKIEFV